MNKSPNFKDLREQSSMTTDLNENDPKCKLICIQCRQNIIWVWTKNVAWPILPRTALLLFWAILLFRYDFLNVTLQLPLPYCEYLYSFHSGSDKLSSSNSQEERIEPSKRATWMLYRFKRVCTCSFVIIVLVKCKDIVPSLWTFVRSAKYPAR